MGIFVCRKCDKCMGSAVKILAAHITKHIKKRTINDYGIMSNFLFGPANHNTKNYWDEGVVFLQYLDPREPSFRHPSSSKCMSARRRWYFHWCWTS